MYVDDPRFTATYDALAPGLARYLRQAIHANARRAVEQAFTGQAYSRHALRRPHKTRPAQPSDATLPAAPSTGSCVVGAERY
jgi:hypothetical protein